MSPLVVMFAWALWHDLSVYRAAEFLPLAGPTYQVTSYDTKTECETEQRADRQRCTTFRYLYWPVGADPARF